jgi:hypothetical protein
MGNIPLKYRALSELQAVQPRILQLQSNTFDVYFCWCGHGSMLSGSLVTMAWRVLRSQM